MVFLCDLERKIERGLPSHAFSTPSSSSTASLSSSSSSMDDSEHGSTNKRNPAPSRQPRRRHEKKPSEHHRKCPQFPSRNRCVALDCEMVGVGDDASRSSLARVVVIDWRGRKLLDEHVVPSEPVTDHRTFVSGITPADLERATTTLETCRSWVSRILRGNVLVGHGLENDLGALGIDHPWWMIRDTAWYEPFMRPTSDGFRPRKLRELVCERLGREIQSPGVPHSPYEDARWAMNLYKTVRSDWESCVQYRIQRSAIEASIQTVHARHRSSRTPHFLYQPWPVALHQ